MNEFLEPRIKPCKSLADLLSSSDIHGFFADEDENMTNMLQKQRIILAGEPGYGKSRILREIVATKNSKNESCIYIDIKSIGKDKIENFISNNVNILRLGESVSIKEGKKFFQTENFRFKDSESATVCLDALDEVRQDDFAEMIDEIKRFINKFKKIQIIVSCRKNYLDKWQHLFTDESFSYFHLLCLSHDQIRIFLENACREQGVVSDVISKLRFPDRFPLVRVPRYLEMLPKFIEKQDSSQLDKITKSSLFDFFVDSSLSIEEEKLSVQNYKSIIRKVLEKMALIMEIYQTNEIKKDELMSFFDDTKSNLNINFLHQVPLEFFYGRSLLKENPGSIEFANTEFQEYLASCEVLNLGRVDQLVFDLMMVQDLREVHPSWLNTLSFLLENKISLLPKFIKSTVHTLGLEDHLRLLPTVGVDELSYDDKEVIFKTVIENYKENGHWIGYEVAERLSLYYEKGFHKYLNACHEIKVHDAGVVEVCKANALLLSGFLVEQQDKFSKKEIALWKKRLLNAINSPYQNEVLPRFALMALANFRDPKVFTKKLVDKVYESGRDTIISNLIFALEKNGLNTSVGVHCILKGIENNIVSARHSVISINEAKSINDFVDGLILNKKILSEFLDHESVYRDDTAVILGNFEQVANPRFIQKMKTLFDCCFAGDGRYDAERSDFVAGLALLIKRHSPDYLFELINDSKNSDYLYSLSVIFSVLLEIKDIPRFAEELKDFEWIAFSSVSVAIKSAGIQANDFEAEAKRFFPNQFNRLELEVGQNKRVLDNQQLELYKQFKLYLEPEKKKYILELFTHYLRHEKDLEKIISDKEKKRLIRLAKNDILSRFNPGNQTIKVTRTSESSSSYSTHSYIHFFGEALKLAHKLKIDAKSARQNILNYLPFAYSDHQEAIFGLINTPSAAEIKIMLATYKRRKDDRIRFMPQSLVQFTKRYKCHEAIPILKLFINEASLSDHDRGAALAVVLELDSDSKKYAQSIFDKFVNDSSGKTNILKGVANEHLIVQFKDPKAIEWRISKIIEAATPFKQVDGVHRVSEFEQELHDKAFAKPLLHLKGREYSKIFINLLEEALNILETNSDYQEYANYLWSISVSYFQNLKHNRSYAPLNELENFIKKHKNRRGINWFLYNFQNLKKEYILFIGKPQNISDCIKQYNRYKEIIYLDIGTDADLYDAAKNILDVSVRQWVEGGAYRMIRSKEKAEDLIQKTITTQIKYFFTKAGLRDPEVIREAELLDGKRIDLLVYYGFIGPVLIEIKLSDNSEITNLKQRVEYKPKLLQYLNGSQAVRGIYLIFQINNAHLRHISSLRKQYKDTNIEVIDIPCILASEKK